MSQRRAMLRGVQVVSATWMMLASILLPWTLQLLDRRRLRREGRDAPWNVASWGSALYAFGPASLWAWGYLTLPRPYRYFVGPAWSGGVIQAIALGDALLRPTPSQGSAEPLLEIIGGGFALAAIGIAVLLLIDGGQTLWRRWSPGSQVKRGTLLYASRDQA